MCKAGRGNGLTAERCTRTAPEQAEQDRSSDGNRGRPKAQRWPERSAVPRQVRGQRGSSSQQGKVGMGEHRRA